MPNKKIQKHTGQRPLPGLTEYDMPPGKEVRPRGMPPLSEIKAETARMGLPDSDAEQLYDTWLVSGFRTKAGPIKDWKAAIRIWHRNGYFPSLKKNPVKAAGEMTNEILDALAANPAYKKIDVQREAWRFKTWCQDNDHKPLVTSFVKFLNAKL